MTALHLLPLIIFGVWIADALRYGVPRLIVWLMDCVHARFNERFPNERFPKEY